MFDDSMTPEDQEPGETSPAFSSIRSKYEFVMAASKEAERLNDRYRNQGVRPLGKVTIEAVARVRKGATRIAYEEPQQIQEEPPKESTYFFSS